MSSSNIVSAIAKLRFLLARKEKLQCAGIVCFALATSLLEVITATVIVVFAQVLTQPEISLKYFDLIGLNQNISSARAVCYIAIICGAIYLIKNIFATIEVFYQNFTIQKIGYHFKNKLLHRYAMADYNAYLTRNSSLGMAVVGGDAELMFSSGMVPLAIIISESIVFSSLLIMIIAMNPILAVIVLGIGSMCSLIVAKCLFPLCYVWGQKLQEAALLSSQNLLQFFHAFKEVVLLGKKEAFIEAYQYHSLKKSKVSAVQNAANTLPRIIIEIFFVELFVLTVCYFCFKNNMPQQIISIMSGYLYAGFRLMPGLNRIISQMNILKANIPSINRVYNEYTTVAAQEHYLSIPNFQFNNNIVFKNVNFKYLNVDQDALENINLEIKKGECIGIIGETGSGKSTLVDVLLGLLKPYQGEVLVDNLYPVNSKEWHQKIGYVPQSVYLVDDTIEANIAFGEKPELINVENLNKAINEAQLKKFIEQLPLGVKTIVGERGIRLSGGERQRIAIARALYRNPEVLIFDEATSALDNETEARLMETINAVKKDRTVIMVAHRLTTLQNCSKIFTIQAGCIINIK